jgi:hypothetical protein
MKINRLKMQFDERKRKLIVSGAICSAKKRFFLVNLYSPDSIQEGEEENIKYCLHYVIYHMTNHMILSQQLILRSHYVIYHIELVTSEVTQKITPNHK